MCGTWDVDYILRIVPDDLLEQWQEYFLIVAQETSYPVFKSMTKPDGGRISLADFILPLTIGRRQGQSGQQPSGIGGRKPTTPNQWNSFMASYGVDITAGNEEH